MRKIRLFTALLVLPISVFAYQMLQDGISMGASYTNSSDYKLWSSVGLIAGYKVVIIEPGIEEKDIPSHPKVFSLSQNYPNPVISGIHIEYALPKATGITLTVYDVTGRTIRTLLAENQEAGYYTVGWDGKDNSGKKVATGIYFYRMETDKFKATRKLTILR